MKSWAMTYHQKGLQTIPVRNKRPLFEGWQDRQYSPQEIASWNWEHGIGILTGPVNRLLVLDADVYKPEAAEFVKGKQLPTTPTCRTLNGGLQYYYRWPETLTTSSTKRELGNVAGIDVRGKGGQVVAPPTPGYAWLPGRELFRIPLANPPEWLLTLLRDPSRPIQGIANGVYSGPRHPEFLRLVCRYLNDGLTIDEIRPMMKNWNENINTNPFDENRFEKELQGAYQPFAQGRYQTYRTKEMLSIMPQSQEANISPTPIGEFMKGDKHIDWLVDRLIPKNGCTLLAGEMKLGKSWAMADLAIEVARGGGLWLGKFPVEGGRVLYIDEENAEQLLRYRIDKLLRGKGKMQKLDLSLLVGKRFKLDSPQSYQELKRIFAEFKPTLVCCDAFVRFHNKDENSATHMAYVNSLIKGLMTEFNCTFFFTDHEPKVQMTEDGKPVKGPGKPRGSGEKIAFSDTVLSLRPTGMKGEMKMYHTYSRWGVPTDTFLISLKDTDHDKTVIRYTSDATTD